MMNKEMIGQILNIFLRIYREFASIISLENITDHVSSKATKSSHLRKCCDTEDQVSNLGWTGINHPEGMTKSLRKGALFITAILQISQRALNFLLGRSSKCI